MAYGSYVALRDKGRLGPALVLSASAAGLFGSGNHVGPALGIAAGILFLRARHYMLAPAS